LRQKTEWGGEASTPEKGGKEKLRTANPEHLTGAARGGGRLSLSEKARRKGTLIALDSEKTKHRKKANARRPWGAALNPREVRGGSDKKKKKGQCLRTKEWEITVGIG